MLIIAVFHRVCVGCLLSNIKYMIHDIIWLKNGHRWMSNTLQWRHNGHNGVSNHQLRHCLLNCLFRCRSKKTPKLRVTGLCEGNSPLTGEFPTQMACNTGNVSIWWHHHDLKNVIRSAWKKKNKRSLLKLIIFPTMHIDLNCGYSGWLHVYTLRIHYPCN